eukprot:2254521-Pleurochrysis_carterae.AAC.1
MAAFRASQHSVAADARYLKYERNARRKAQELRDKALSVSREMQGELRDVRAALEAAEKQANREQTKTVNAVAARNKYYDMVRGLEKEIEEEAKLRKAGEKKVTELESKAGEASKEAAELTKALDALEQNYKERIVELE